MTPSQLMLDASLACSAAFYVASAAVIAIRRPLVPPTLPATSDMGAETPAVANLLANGGEVTPDAVPATLLDLAARKIVEIEEAEPQKYVCRLEATAPPALTRYETRVLDLLRSRAAGGIVPAAALTAGPADQARSWHRSFRNEVVGEAKRAGLSVPRWPPQVLTGLGLLLFAAFGLVALAADNNSDTQDAMWFVALVVALVTVAISNRIFRDDAQMISRAGLDRQARWLSLRKYLHEDELFASLPPTAVAVRDRYLAYGAALGVAATAVRAVPMGAENDRRAWSHFGGRWRQVTVSYPTVWPPAWGSSPGEAALRGIKLGALGLFWLWASSLVLGHVAFGEGADQLMRDLSAGAAAVGAIALVCVGAGFWLVLAAAVSRFGTSEVTGDAVRLRQFGEEGACYLAVDRGTNDHIRAWRLKTSLYASLTEYTTVTVSVTPLLGHVKLVRRTATATRTGAAPATTGS